MLFNMANKTSSCRELNNINKIKKADYDCSSRDGSSFSRDLESSDSSISPLSERYGDNTLKREVNKLYHAVSTNINYNQVNDSIENELKFDSSNSPANDSINDTLHIVTISLRCGKSLDIP